MAGALILAKSKQKSGGESSMSIVVIVRTEGTGDQRRICEWYELLKPVA